MKREKKSGSFLRNLSCLIHAYPEACWKLLFHLDPGAIQQNLFWSWKMLGEQCAGYGGASQMDDSTEQIVHADAPSLSSWADIVLMVSQKSCAAD